MTEVAIVRGRYIDESEIANYESIKGYDITLIGASGTSYDGPLPYETYPSAASPPNELLRKGAAALSGAVFGADTYLYGLTENLSEYDIVHVAETYHGFADQAIEAKERYGCSVVSTVWQNIPYFFEDNHYSRGPKQSLANANSTEIKDRFRRESDGLLAVTEQVEFALKAEGVNEEKIHHVPIGVDTKRFQPGRLDESQHTATDYGMIKNGVNIIFVGRTPWQKGVYDLLSAWRMVQERTDVSVQLSIVGAGDNHERLRKYANHLNLSDVSIRSRLPYEEIPLVMDGADILVLPSIPTRYWQEQYGRVVPESQACETAVVASDTGGIPEAAGQIGKFVRPGDAQDIAETLVKLAEDSTERDRLARKGRKQILNNRTLKTTAEAVTDVYDRVTK